MHTYVDRHVVSWDGESCVTLRETPPGIWDDKGAMSLKLRRRGRAGDTAGCGDLGSCVLESCCET